MNELQFLRRLKFDWVVRSESVWEKPKTDVSSIHADAREELNESLEELQETDTSASPLGIVLVGRGGVGKTHLLQWLRTRAFQEEMNFLFADMTGVRDFWETMQLQIIAAIDQEAPDGHRQCQHVLAGLLNSVVKTPQKKPIVLADKLAKWNLPQTFDYTQKLISHLIRRHRVEMMQHQDVLRALIMLNSDNIELNNAANAWLHGTETDEDLLRRFAFTSSQRAPIDIVRGISWLLSLRGPTVLAIDQLDNLVSQQISRFQNVDAAELEDIMQDDDEARRLQAITQNVAGGLADLVQTVMKRTQVVISCYDTTWHHLLHRALRSSTDRFQNAIVLSELPHQEAARQMIEQRIDLAAARENFKPARPWLIAPEAFEGTAGLSPRELLKRCDEHRRRCLKRQQIELLTTFNEEKSPKEPASSREDRSEESPLDRVFLRQKETADTAPYLTEEDDRCWPDLLESTLTALIYESPIPSNVDMLVDSNLASAKSYKYLHARLKIVNHQRQGKEQQFCFRALLHTNAIAFQNRLKAAITDAGIDNKLGFRSLTLIRNTAYPGGKKTRQLLQRYDQLQGHWAGIADEELRTLIAVHHMLASHDVDMPQWLQVKCPMSRIGFIQESGLLDAIREHAEAGGSTLRANDTKETFISQREESSDQRDSAPMAEELKTTTVSDGQLPFGYTETASGDLDEPVAVAWKDLTRHLLVVAGSGSGKTNLLKRIIEEATIAGIPSIVVDCNNDLIGLAKARSPEAFPPEWRDEDHRKESLYRRACQVVTWTPNRQTGNPIVLPLLPDFQALADDPDGLQNLTVVTTQALEKDVASGQSVKARKMRGVLSELVKHFAEEGGGSIEKLIEMMREPSPGLDSGITDQEKYAEEMADLLQSKLNQNPLWNTEGVDLDPATLFGLHSKKIRISILSMIGLLSQEMQQGFLNSLGHNLFTWIKSNPAPEGKLRGLLVIDEAKEFVPSSQASACKETLVRLTSQARKYGLGILFATQAPKDIDHRILNNCFTQLYGQIHSPAAVQAAKELLKQKGAPHPEKITNLNKGQFFFHNGEVNPTPIRIRTPQCLSHHTQPMTEDEVLELARKSRRLIEKEN